MASSSRPSNREVQVVGKQGSGSPDARRSKVAFFLSWPEELGAPRQTVWGLLPKSVLVWCFCHGKVLVETEECPRQAWFSLGCHPSGLLLQRRAATTMPQQQRHGIPTGT